jgi:hypothetical protein
MSIAPSTGSLSRTIKQLHFDSPLDAVFLRTLAWECYVARRTLTVGQVVKEQVRIARSDLGLPSLGERDKSGAADDYVQRLRKKGHLSDKLSAPCPLDPRWQDEWRALYLPSHAQVRQLSHAPVIHHHSLVTSAQRYATFRIALRDPALPMLDVWIGPDTSIQAVAANRRGLYIWTFAKRDEGGACQRW